MSQRYTLRVGFYSAIATAVLTIVTFAFALTAIPISGANCREGCISYPYLDSVSQFPKDYLWMFPAIILVLAFVVLMAAIHAYASREKQIFSQIGLSFAVSAAAILLIDYFVQLSVVPISLINNETEGIALLTQYNPHGIFIALEELGYIMMSLSLLCMAPVLIGNSRLESTIGWIFIAGFVLMVIALGAISFNFGLDRKDRFEVFVISINWLVLIFHGVLLAIVFRSDEWRSELLFFLSIQSLFAWRRQNLSLRRASNSRKDQCCSSKNIVR